MGNWKRENFKPGMGGESAGSGIALAYPVGLLYNGKDCEASKGGKVVQIKFGISKVG